MDLCSVEIEADLALPTKRETPTVSIRHSSMASAPGYTMISGMRQKTNQRLISVTSPLRMWWDLFIMLLAIWNCFYVPFAVAFFPEKDSLVLVVADIVIDVAYILDIAVYARSSYVDLGTGEEVTDSWKILVNYFRTGKLAIDILSAVPFDVIALITAANQELQLFTLSKIVRLLRLSKIIMFMQTKSRVKLKLKLTQLFFIFVTYLHLVACVWFLLTSMSQEYVPPAMYISHHEYDLFSSSTLQKYAYSLYMSVYMLTAAEIGPRVSLERIFVGFTLLLGQMFQAFMFGEIAVVLFDLNRKSQEITSIQNAAATTMIHMQLGQSLRSKITTYLISSQSSFIIQSEFEEFFRTLPPSLKQEVRVYVFEHIMTLNPAVSGHEELSACILRRLKNMYCRPEEKIVVQGEDAAAIFFVAAGKCAVWVMDEFKDLHRTKHLNLGAHFGEIAMLFPTQRTATVVAVNYMSLAVLEKEDFVFVCRKFPKAKGLFMETALRYHDNWKRFIKKTLRRCPFFRELNSKVLSSIIYRLPTTRLEANTHLYKEGDFVDRITFVIDGNVEVYASVNDALLLSSPSGDVLTREQITFVSRCKFKHQSLKQIKKGDMRFPAKIAIDELGMGSVLCSNLALLRETVNIYAKTTQPTVVMTLSWQLLQSLCAESNVIRDAVNRHRAILNFEYPLARVTRMQMTMMDYEKGFVPGTANKAIKLWYAKMKVRRCALGKLIEKRKIRERGFPDLLTLTHKMKALLEAERTGDADMAEKIRRGVLPTSADRLYPALRLLQLNEVENPILTQFATEAVKVSEFVTTLRDGLIGANERLSVLAERRKETKERVVETHTLLRLLTKLCEGLDVNPLGDEQPAQPQVE